ncbi:AraC family transcriptional regulator [bacterium]|nr:AraC family transcriptional regulator [bacterium]NUN45374.1 helix-turn-helix transcriptional regulator [bacterium]
MTDQLNAWLLAAGGFQTIFLSVLLMRRTTDRAKPWLVLLMAALAVQIFSKAAAKSWMMHHATSLYQFSYLLPWWVPIFLYGYVRVAMGEPAWRKFDSLFLVFPIAGFWLSWMGLRWGYDLLSSVWIAGSIQIVHLGVLTWKMLQLVREKNAERFVRRFVIAIVAAELLIIFALHAATFFFLDSPVIRLFFLSLSVFVYWATFEALRHRTESVQPSDKYAHSGLSEADVGTLYGRIHSSMLSHKLFLEPDLTIDRLASVVNLPRHHISQAINSVEKRNFYEFVQQFRVAEAVRLLRSPEHDHLTIAAIAYESGFNSLSSFNDAFKKIVKTTPSAFRRDRNTLVITTYTFDAA